ncbi:MaoC family dehydratase [Streptomyces hypolithicus]
MADDTLPFAFARRRSISADAPLPATRLTRPGVRIDHGHLAAYARVCGFSGTAPLPLTYPHVLAFPLALRVMARRAFPLPLTGLVHTSITITRHRALYPDDRPELTVYAEKLSPHRRGTEVTMVTQARLEGPVVWESRSTYLARHRTDTGHAGHPAHTGLTGLTGLTGTDAPRTSPAEPAAPLPAVATWDLSGNLGRRYGLASGDLNPIHLHPLTAKPFGFPRTVAHGMWTFARCVAELRPADAAYVRTDFRAPVLLPATVTYAATRTAAGDDFELRGEDGRVHLRGGVRADPTPSQPT